MNSLKQFRHFRIASFFLLTIVLSVFWAIPIRAQEWDTRSAMPMARKSIMNATAIRQDFELLPTERVIRMRHDETS